MKINKLFTLLLVFVLVFSTVGTVFAQDETPTDTVAGDEGDGEEGDGEEGGDEWTHPMISLFEAYFEISTADSGDGGEGGEGGEGEEGGEGDPSGGDSGGDTGGDTAGEEMSFGEEIGTYHKDGMGFGLLANLLALAELSQESCSVEDGGDGGGEAVCGSSLGELVDSFKSGSGLGQLYKDYGKPEKHGVGYLHQEVKGEEDKGKPGGYEVGDEVLVAFDEDTGEWALAKKNNKNAVSATVVAVTETEDGALMLELTVEGETIFLTIEEKAQGKPDKDNGKPEDEGGKPGYEVGDVVLVAYDEDTGEWALAKKNNKNAVNAIVVDVTENEDGIITLGLDIEGHGIIFLTIEEKGQGKPDKDTGKPDKPDNPNKPDKP